MLFGTKTRWTGSGDYGSYPPGCFLDGGEYQYFNTNLDSTAAVPRAGGDAPAAICKGFAAVAADPATVSMDKALYRWRDF